MEKASRRRYTLRYKQEAVRLVPPEQKVAAAAQALGIVEQTLANWVKADKVDSTNTRSLQLDRQSPRTDRKLDYDLLSRWVCGLEETRTRPDLVLQPWNGQRCGTVPDTASCF